MATFDRSTKIYGATQLPMGRRDRTKPRVKGEGSLGRDRAAAFDNVNVPAELDEEHGGGTALIDPKAYGRRVTAAIGKSPEGARILNLMTNLGLLDKYEGMTYDEIVAEQAAKAAAANALKDYRAPRRSVEELLKEVTSKYFNAANDHYAERGALGNYKAALNLVSSLAGAKRMESMPADKEAALKHAETLQKEIAVREAKLAKLAERMNNYQTRIDKYMSSPDDPTMLDDLYLMLEQGEGSSLGKTDKESARDQTASNEAFMSERLANEAAKPVEAKVKEINEVRPGTDNDLTLQKVKDVKNVTEDSKAARKADEDLVYTLGYGGKIDRFNVDPSGIARKADADKRGRKNIISAISKNLPGM